MEIICPIRYWLRRGDGFHPGQNEETRRGALVPKLESLTFSPFTQQRHASPNYGHLFSPLTFPLSTSLNFSFVLSLVLAVRFRAPIPTFTPCTILR
ncbi:hypothetical protein HETIRDRAFT_388394 [Heterobasidion irregulare TC 32-1]|uniref:Uncharacterized protein n=1 Tax=Heterobasidion irregulare (strain TC 32-1) TaxID=747525 RepID=W4JZQ1_HETIT|nr:uncharacterized protein HETIRDRAFT_388394 [Heterobasidion irregulare TC 32-1]ETW78316.1 hypothetical protein HETIRDRAFT_388394 [Heterobasidion irregulare TC 32-1]